MELTLKQYADTLGISYEAVRGSFNTHKDKDLLEGTHYRKTGRQRILTDAGITAMNEYRAKPLSILPGDVARYEARIADLEEQIRTLEDQIAAQNTENADLRLRITGLESELADHKDRLINALFLLQEAQGRLLTATEETKKPGFFARLFGKK